MPPPFPGLDDDGATEKYSVSLFDENPTMPTAQRMLEIIAKDPVAQARFFIIRDLSAHSADPLRNSDYNTRRSNGTRPGFHASPTPTHPSGGLKDPSSPQKAQGPKALGPQSLGRPGT